MNNSVDARQKKCYLTSSFIIYSIHTCNLAQKHDNVSPTSYCTWLICIGAADNGMTWLDLQMLKRACSKNGFFKLDVCLYKRMLYNNPVSSFSTSTFYESISVSKEIHTCPSIHTSAIASASSVFISSPVFSSTQSIAITSVRPFIRFINIIL